jgi:hypothetical protein
MHPEPDKQYREHKLTKIEPGGKDGGWFMTMDDGWGFWCPADSPVEPKPGMTARLYGKGIGFPIRGLYLNDTKVYYWTEVEHAEKREVESYGASGADWLDRWDRGDACWTIEMGGLGPGYEQCIHITAAEVLRHLIHGKYEHVKWSDAEQWKQDRERIEKWSFEAPIVKQLGLSGAQWGAALQLATQFYSKGPRAILTDPKLKDRHIQVQKNFPQAAAA